MKTMNKAALFAVALSVSPMIAASAAQAQAVAVVDLEGAIQQSAAMQAAQTQIQTTYKAQIDAFNARNTAINTELQPLAREIQTLQNNPATPPATLQAKANAYRARQQTAQTELQRLAQPFGRPSTYAQEQVAEKVEPALRAAMAAKNVTLVLRPEAAILALPAADLTGDVATQLNALVRTVSITPPAGWQPGQKAAQAQTQGR